MSRIDPAASAALDGDVLPIWLIFLDFADEPLRGCTAGFDFTVTGTGDPELDGHTFEAINSRMVDISDINSGQGGTDTVSVQISGIAGLDSDALDQMNNAALYQGRLARLWRIIRDLEGNQIGAVQAYYTGYMTGAYVDSSPTEQIINLDIEGYLSAYSAPSNRTYLDQELYDPGDLSARAAIAIANSSGADPSIGSGVASVGNSISGGGSSSGGYSSSWKRANEF